MRAKYVRGSAPYRFSFKYQLTEAGCWEWQASLNEHGYGQFNKGAGDIILAHRYSYILYIGYLEDHLFVCHKCDNPKCVNPFHLFKGSNSDNMQDASKKGRLKSAIHPSLAYYNKGCRCDECVKLSREDCKRRRLLNGDVWNANRRAKKTDAVIQQTGDNPQATASPVVAPAE